MDTNTIIEEMGGTKRASERCRISESAVRYWRINGIPPKHWRSIHQATGIAYEVLAFIQGQPRASKTEHISEPVSRVMERLKNG